MGGQESALLTRLQMMLMLRIPAPHLRTTVLGRFWASPRASQSPRLVGVSIEGNTFPPWAADLGGREGLLGHLGDP